MERLKHCNLCPRKCGTDRSESVGFCLAPQNPKIARAALHYWEEPCISGKNGSGTVFFSGCNLKCVYCQNLKISKQGFGKEVSVDRLGEIFLELQQQGAHNINLVSPTPYALQIIEAIDLVRSKMKIPFVYNTGGYESIETLRLLRGYIDIFLTDIKYKNPVLSKKYSGAEDYFEVAFNAAREMMSLCKKPRFDENGMMLSGVIIRHLVLPGLREDSIEILEEIAKELPKDGFLLSLMSQYTPNERLAEDYSEVCRKITTFEYNSVVDAAIRLGLDKGYIQEKSSAEEKYTPPFDLSGV
jgi:putative pyruvate formate lyase activating enzyme